VLENSKSKDDASKKLAPQLCCAGTGRQYYPDSDDDSDSLDVTHAAGGCDGQAHIAWLGVGLRNRRGETPLICAARLGQLAIIKFLLEEADSSVGEMDIYHRTALSHAAEQGHYEIVRRC
jgi:hypothetical protein